jgi:hypothetical protein
MVAVMRPARNGKDASAHLTSAQMRITNIIAPA